MVDPNLIKYIKDARLQGASDDVIKQVLLNTCWQEQQINDGFVFINLESASPIPSAPVPTSPSVSPELAQPQISGQPVKEKISIKPRTDSPYASLLAVVLFLSLMILMNNLIYDLIDYFDPSIDYNTPAYSSFSSGDPSIKLTVSAFVVVPFWFITFLLYYFYHDKKLKVLLSPYYVTSGWLLIWLLFQVSLLLLSSNATFGVYFVLILMGVVLTGVVWGIQRYRNLNKEIATN